MKSKKGMVGLIIGVIIILFVIGTTIFFFMTTYPENKVICEKDFKMIELMDCINNLEDIKTCQGLNATWIKTEGHLFSSPTLICYKDGEILRI